MNTRKIQAQALRTTSLLVLPVLTFGSIAMSSPMDESLVKQIRHRIAEVRAAKDAASREASADAIPELTRKVKPDTVDDRTFTELVSLLDSPYDSIRMNVAAALGFLGHRARPAAPKLLEMLPAADRLDGTITSADAIRLALKRMGIKPPPPPKDDRRVGA